MATLRAGSTYAQNLLQLEPILAVGQGTIEVTELPPPEQHEVTDDEASHQLRAQRQPEGQQAVQIATIIRSSRNLSHAIGMG